MRVGRGGRSTCIFVSSCVAGARAVARSRSRLGRGTASSIKTCPPVGQGQGSIEGEDASAMDFYSADGEANGLWNDMHVHGDVVVGENLAHDESCFGCDRVFGMNVLCQTTRGSAGVARPIIG